MTVQALRAFERAHGVQFAEVVQVPLEGEGVVERRVERLYKSLTENEAHMSAVRNADVVFVVAHSQGSVVAAHLVDRLFADGVLVSGVHASGHGHGEEEQGDGVVHSALGVVDPGASAIGVPPPPRKGRTAQRVCLLAMCGIHLGPLRYLSSSTLVGPYLQYFESMAARELFEFQNTESAVSKAYVGALTRVLDHGTKVVYIASLNDQVVPIYSGLFTAANHPLILRALYIDGDAYHSSDFLCALLILLLRIRNAGLPDSGLLAHLSEATAGSLSGIGHSTAYEEEACYRLAVDYLFLADDGRSVQEVLTRASSPSDPEHDPDLPPYTYTHPPLTVDPFNAAQEQNDYEIPWALRDVIADERIAWLFREEFERLKRAFGEWAPRTGVLREVKRKLQPITRLGSGSGGVGVGVGGGVGMGRGGGSKL
uniref:YMC020W-like alpha/beta hydrolase domain-containing protein n=1 Tax=Psilocybe cubensis TaxID=181762 RepID=A0A8H7XJY9_PSICU